MERNEDGSFNIYTCPACGEDYYVFDKMMDCWKSDAKETK